MEEFLKQLLFLNVLFPLFITVTAIIFYTMGLPSSFILGTTLLLLMGYNVIMARYGFILWNDIRKGKIQDNEQKANPS
jgi:hypothetical protein